jgi:hypothetical protein
MNQLDNYKQASKILKKVIRLEYIVANKISNVKENDLVRNHVLELQNSVFNLVMASRPPRKSKRI